MINYNTKRTIRGHTILGVALAIIYSFIYDYITRQFMFGVFSYLLKYEYHPMSTGVWLLYTIISVVPLFFYKGFVSIASIISLFCYLLVYIPFTHTLFVAGYPFEITFIYVLFFFIAQCCFFSTDLMQLGKREFGKKRVISFEVFELVCLLLMVLLIILNYQKMQLVNIFDQDEKSLLYELRAERGSALKINDYLMGWMNHVLLPILMVCYLKEKKYIKLGIAFVCMILVFMIDMQKISFLIPFIIVIFFCLYKYLFKIYTNYFHVLLLVPFILLPLFALKNMDTSLGFTIASLLVMRTLCVAGRQFAAYFSFFEIKDNPYTYFSHIKIINNVTGLYPYNDSLGYVVSYGEANSNATFFLMDGIAGMGFLGCIFAALLFILFKSFLNTIGNNYDKYLCVIVLLFAISSLMNSSIFTSFITGGFLLFYIVCRTVDLKALTV